MKLQFCTTCNEDVEVDDFARCSACDGFVGGQRTEATPEQRAAALDAARAQVTWGHPRKRVVQDLVHKGLTRDLAEVAYEEAMEERAVAFKARGKKTIFIGLAVLVPAAAIMLASSAFGWDSTAAKPLFLFSTFAAMLSGTAIAFGAVNMVTGGRQGDDLLRG